MQQELEFTTADIYDRESDSELDEMLDSEYYPTDSDEETSDSDDEPKPQERTGVIYRLTAEGCDKVYIGSTVNLKRRISVHKSNSKCASRLILAYGNYTFTEIATLKFTDIKQLRRLETDIILEYGDKVVNICGTKDSYSKDYWKKQQEKESYKNYYTTYKKDYNKKTFFCDSCKKEISLPNKKQHFKTKKHISKTK